MDGDGFAGGAAEEDLLGAALVLGLGATFFVGFACVGVLGFFGVLGFDTLVGGVAGGHFVFVSLAERRVAAMVASPGIPNEQLAIFGVVRWCEKYRMVLYSSSKESALYNHHRSTTLSLFTKSFESS